MARRLVDDGDEPQRDRESEHHPNLYDAREDDEPQPDGQYGGERLCHQQHSPAVESIRDRAAPQPEQQNREKTERERRAEGDTAAGEGGDEPGLSHGLHPRAHLRYEIAREIQAVVARVE